MKFRIQHESKLFRYGIIVSLFAAFAAILMFMSLGLTAQNAAVTMILFGIFAICSASVILFTILYIIERIFGAAIVVQNDHVDIRLLLRHKRFYYDKIVEAKYSHYDDNEDQADGYESYRTGPRIRSKLTFTLISGKCFSLNDKAKSYQYKRNLWITNPEIDPDEDVKLYQMYRCFCSMHDSYMNAKRTSPIQNSRQSIVHTMHSD